MLRIGHNLIFLNFIYHETGVKYTCVHIYIYFTFDNDNIIINEKPLVSLHKKQDLKVKRL